MFCKTLSQHEKLPSQYSLLPENPHFNQSNKVLSEKEVMQPAKKWTKQPLLKSLCYPSEKMTHLRLSYAQFEIRLLLLIYTWRVQQYSGDRQLYKSRRTNTYSQLKTKTEQNT